MLPFSYHDVKGGGKNVFQNGGGVPTHAGRHYRVEGVSTISRMRKKPVVSLPSAYGRKKYDGAALPLVRKLCGGARFAILVHETSVHYEFIHFIHSLI